MSILLLCLVWIFGRGICLNGSLLMHNVARPISLEEREGWYDGRMDRGMKGARRMRWGNGRKEEMKE